MDLILFGRQGSGKGTQADYLVQDFGYTIFAMSGELKKVIAAGGALGQKIQGIIARGELVGDDIIMEIVEQWYRQFTANYTHSKILFDGIPRTLAQKDAFERIITRETKGLLIEITSAEAEERMLGRRVCSVCHSPALPGAKVCAQCGGELIRRSDDNEAAIQKRLALYEQETMPVVRWYADQGRMLVVDGSQSVEAVTADIAKLISA